MSRTKIPSGQITLKLTVEGADASFLEALRSALPEIRAALPDGHRFDINFIEASVAAQEVGGWGSPSEMFGELTPRQREILDLLATGLSNKEIGRKLALSHFTIRNHISQIMRLLKVSSRQEVAGALALFEHQSSSNVETAQVQR